MFFNRNTAANRRRKSLAPRARLSVEALEARTVPYALTGNSWIWPELVTLSFVPDGADVGGVASNLVSTLNARFGSAQVWQHEFIRAAQAWAQQTNLNFAVVFDDGTAYGGGAHQQGSPLFGDIRIGGYNFGTPTLARAYLPPSINNFSIAGDVLINSGQSWVMGTIGGYDLFTTALHEVGHALGLGHSTSYSAAMYPSYVGQRLGLGADDSSGIRALYSPGQVRTHDAFDLYASNDTLATPSWLNDYVNPTTLTGVVSGLDVSNTSDVDFYRLTVPAGTSGTLRVKLQSSGMSLLSPILTVYNGAQQQVGVASGAGQYGSTLSVTVNGIAAGETYYIRAVGAESTAFGTGRYSLGLNVGAGADPTIWLPWTATLNGTPLSGGGGVPAEDGYEYRANTFTAGAQQAGAWGAGQQALAADAAGNYLIVWQSQDQDGAGSGIFAQRFNTFGEPVGTEFQVNSFTAGAQTSPTVAMDVDGDFVVTWSNFGENGWDIYARRFNAQAEAQGEEFLVNLTTVGDQVYSTIAMDADGDFVVAWQNPDGDGSGVFARRFDSNGDSSGELAVSATTAGDQVVPSVAMDADGDFVVAWSGVGNEGWDVLARRYDGAAAPQGDPFVVNATTAGDQGYASVAADPLGSFVVVWSSLGQDGDGWGVFGQRYNAQGDAQGGEFQVNTHTIANQAYPTVSLDGGANFVITWSSQGQDGDGWGILGRYYEATGEPKTGEFLINTTTAGDQHSSSVLMTSMGNFVAVWNGSGVGDDQGVFSQRYEVYHSDNLNGYGEAFSAEEDVLFPGSANGYAAASAHLAQACDSCFANGHWSDDGASLAGLLAEVARKRDARND